MSTLPPDIEPEEEQVPILQSLDWQGQTITLDEFRQHAWLARPVYRKVPHWIEDAHLYNLRELQQALTVADAKVVASRTIYRDNIEWTIVNFDKVNQ